MQKAYVQGYLLGLRKSKVSDESTLFNEEPEYPIDAVQEFDALDDQTTPEPKDKD